MDVRTYLLESIPPNFSCQNENVGFLKSFSTLDIHEDLLKMFLTKTPIYSVTY